MSITESAAATQRWARVAAAVFVLTVGQLAVAEFIPGLPQFEGKAFGARLVFYPLLMAITPILYWLARRHSQRAGAVPWRACAFIMLPFFIDVTGNTLNFYNSLDHWDDLNHFTNWLLLCLGLGQLIAASGAVGARWLLVIVVTGIGAALAIGWELAEWYTFIRQGTELHGAYEDTLSDEALGTLGALVAALLVAWWEVRPRGPVGSLGDTADL